jgi:hypothetical protein
MELFTLTFRASQTAPIGLTDPITISFANSANPNPPYFFFENPANADNDYLQIILPCGTIGGGEVVGTIGRVIIAANGN